MGMSLLDHVRRVYGEETSEEELKPLYRALRNTPSDLLFRIAEWHERASSSLAPAAGEGFKEELERRRELEALRDEFRSYGDVEEWVVLNEYARRYGRSLVEFAERARAAEVPDEVLEHAVWGLYYEWRWARAAVPPLVEVENGKARVKYDRAEDWVRRRFCIVSYRGVSLWIYEDGAFRENIREIVEAVKQGLRPWITEESKVRGIVDEILWRLEAPAYRDFPFNALGTQFVPVENGVLWRRGDGNIVLLPHSPSFGYTYRLPVRYDPNARCPRIDRFVSEVVSEESRRILYEIAASCLLPATRYHAAYMLVGSGSNGKSTYLELLQRFLGKKNVANVSLQELVSNRFKPAQLVGKLANIYADIPKRPLHDTGMFKMLTGGDRITVEKKFKDPFEFENTARLIFSANELPEVNDQTYAFWRRWIVVQFPNVFPPNPKLIEELTTPEELSGFLNRVLEVLDEIEERGDLTRTGEVEKMMEEWMRRSNSVYAFVRDCVEFSSTSFVPKDEVYAAYVEYCEEHDYRTLPKNAFAAELMRQVRGIGTGRRKVGGRRVYTWEGIRLKRKHEGAAATLASSAESAGETPSEIPSETPSETTSIEPHELKQLGYEVRTKCGVCGEPRSCFWMTKDGSKFICRDCRYKIVGRHVEAKIFELVEKAQKVDERGLLREVLLRRLAEYGDVAERKLEELIEQGDLHIYRDETGEYVRR